MEPTDLSRDPAWQESLREPVSIGVPLAKRANQLQILEEKRRPFRPAIYWYLTFRCNLACAHCSVHSSPWVDNSQDLNTQECMEVIEQMSELNVGVALLTGGEVFIRPDAMDILRALGDEGIAIGVETNGIRYPQGFADLARSLQSRRLLTMTISLDGGTRETHERLRGDRSFHRTTSGLRFLKENGVHFDIQCVLNRSNFETIPDIYRLATDLYPECRTVDWAILNPSGRGGSLVKELGLQSQHLHRVLDLVHQWHATFPGSTNLKVPPAVVPPRYLPLISGGKVKPVTSCQFPLLGVLPNGDVTICALSREDQSLYFGNVRDRDVRLKSIWENTRMGMLRSRYVAAQDLQGICGDCVWKYKCKGACRAWAYEEGGSFEAPYPICKELDEAGTFPKAYRLSHQNATVAAKYKQMQISCGCS